MWKVIQERDARGIRYCVENQETGEVHGTHDCLKWAQRVADWLNEKEAQHEHD